MFLVQLPGGQKGSVVGLLDVSRNSEAEAEPLSSLAAVGAAGLVIRGRGGHGKPRGELHEAPHGLAHGAFNGLRGHFLVTECEHLFLLALLVFNLLDRAKGLDLIREISNDMFEPEVLEDPL